MATPSPAHPRQVDNDSPGQLSARTRRPLIGVVDDESDLVAMTVDYLIRDGFAVVTAGDVRGAAALLRAHPLDLLVLDLMLPDGSGLDLLRGVIAGRHLPVVILTGRAEEHERVLGLELGADDYVVKPFSLPELGARLRAVLRRAGTASNETVHRVGALAVDTRSRQVSIDGQAVALTALEFDLLATFAAAPRQVFTAGQLLADVWGSAAERRERSAVAEHVYRLRRKLTQAGVAPLRIVTVRGVGYRLDP
ncbi:response regulator [Plantactinospora siamensis]|uniref:Response regulator n=1 Tax=Plantactinospora siamensis TaxID=555372 RepID=A0ABV6NQC1_9ACTN